MGYPTSKCETIRLILSAGLKPEIKLLDEVNSLNGKHCESNFIDSAIQEGSELTNQRQPLFGGYYGF
jgi:hypothetical protein